MKAALALCRTVRITHKQDGVALTLFIPTVSRQHNRRMLNLLAELFRYQRVLVTRSTLDESLGVKSGKYNPEIPVLTDALAFPHWSPP